MTNEGSRLVVLSQEDMAVLADMKQRELHLKGRQRAADAIGYRMRRYRMVMSFLAALGFAATIVVLVVIVAWIDPAPTRWNLAGPAVGAGAFVGVLIGQRMWESPGGRRLLAKRESLLRDRYSGDLHAGRRWLPFYYRGEDISEYVPQILYFIESEGRFDSVDAALGFARENRRSSTTFAAEALRRFEAVASQTNALVLSSADESGRPSSRVMRFVRTARPGVWLVTTAPQGPKVHELDRGLAAVVTSPTEAGAVISSNRLVVRRAEVPFADVAGLYDDQVPGYVDGMTAAEQDRELVYELELLSARVDTWMERDVVEF